MTIEELYRRRADQFSAAEARWAFRERMVMHLRVATFLVAAALFALAWQSVHAGLWCLGGAIALAGFSGAVAYHDRVREQMLRNRLLRQINEQAIARLQRHWHEVPLVEVELPPRRQATSVDLDLFGHASLFHLLATANTPLGIAALRDGLVEPASPEVVERRQQAVAELAPHLDLRQTLILEGRLLGGGGRSSGRFVDWAEGAPWLAARPCLRWLCRGLSAGAALILAAGLAGALPAEAAALALFAVLLANVNLTVLFGRKVHDILMLSNLRRGEAARYLRLFELVCSAPGAGAELEAVRGEAARLGGGVLLRMRQLNRIASLATIRHVPLLFYFLYLPVQLLFLYDFHVLDLLEAWQGRYGRYARRWFLALGRFEALCSLAALVHDNPGWTMPRVDPAADRLQARSLAHPLLPGDTCVANDVEIGPAGSFLLVTGSNMSGKSTLLRAVGVNVALAQAGAPVRAECLTLPPAELATSMRVRDSLEDGVSFYMAELMRLKEIVDAARDPAARGGRKLLYLLDEILLGTNSQERHLAVVRVVGHLVGSGAIGAISTHDLDLATSPALAAACRCVHFRETLHDHGAPRPMTFDYRLRPGIATTSNALKLLQIVGLE